VVLAAVAGALHAFATGASATRAVNADARGATAVLLQPVFEFLARSGKMMPGPAVPAQASS
jgi:hypothetical protein